MTFSHQDIAAVERLGYTADEARFLYLVAVHSGYFVPRQFLAFSGAKWGNRSHTFVSKLESRGHVTWRQYDRIGGVYHLFSRSVYRPIGQENHANRQRHSAQFVRTRLLLLDFILENLGFAYFETESEKVAYFCDVLGVDKKALPAKTYEGGSSREPSLRYFVDKFPMFLDYTVPNAPPVITFSYVNPGPARVTGFANHLQAYLPLFRRLGQFCFLYIANSAAHFLRAEKRYTELVGSSLKTSSLKDILRYFRLRNAWELKQYGSVSASDLEWLKEASQRFQDDGHLKDSYRAWASGTLSEEALRAGFEQSHLRSEMSFRTCLVAVTRLGKSE